MLPGHSKAILDDVERHLVDRLNMPQNLILYLFSLPHRLPQNQLHEIRDLLAVWVHRDSLASIAGYPAVIQTLFEMLKGNIIADVFLPSHTIAKRMCDELSQDVSLIRDQLTNILRDPGMHKNFLACRGDLAQQLLDLLQDLLDSFPNSPDRPSLSRALLDLASASQLHPTCFPISGLEQIGQQVAAGTFSDIFQGSVQGQAVSVKRMRIFEDTDVKIALKAFGREAHIWRQLSHPNLLPFLGLYYHQERLCLVSPWMSNGHILQFLENSPRNVDRLPLILDIAMGLEYLHSRTIVHGDLKGINILMTPSCRACIADFGLSCIADAMTLRFTHSTGGNSGGTARYQAPELILATQRNHMASDIYAFACVAYEIITGKAPFFEIPNDVAVGIQVISGFRPTRPQTMPFDTMWMLLEDCWAHDPACRPNAAHVIQRLRSPLIGAKSVQAIQDWDDVSSARFRRRLKDWPLVPSVAWIRWKVFDEVADEDGDEDGRDDLMQSRGQALQTPVPHAAERLPGTRRRPRRTPSLAQTQWRPSPILFPGADYEFRGLDPAKWTRFNIPYSCLVAEHHHASLPDDDDICEVFLYNNESIPSTPRSHLAGIYEAPAASQTVAVGSQNQALDFESMCRNYVAMLRQQPPETSVDTGTDEGIHDWLSSSPNDPLFDSIDAFYHQQPVQKHAFNASPAFSTDSTSSFASPAEPLYDDSFTSPGNDSPFIATPSQPTTAYDDLLAGENLFGGVLSQYGGIHSKSRTSDAALTTPGSTASPISFGGMGGKSTSRDVREVGTKRYREETADVDGSVQRRSRLC